VEGAPWSDHRTGDVLTRRIPDGMAARGKKRNALMSVFVFWKGLWTVQ
jgi:hypothetical protein